MGSANILVFISCFSFVISQNLLCTKSFCREYISKIGCLDEIPDNCRIQNDTHNGVELPFMGPCNCCDYCLANLNEGDACTVGGPTSLIPASICGDKLFCDNKICKKLVTVCTQAQAKYDQDRANGILGHLQLRPNCDRNGNFEPYVCIPGEICYCVDEAGERIFGEIAYSSIGNTTLSCKCSRAYNKFEPTLGRPLLPNEHLHCLPDGNYDSLQCMGTKCFCSDKDGRPIKSNVVDITEISQQSMPCFDNKTHIEYTYYRNCENKYRAYYEEIQKYTKMGYDVIGSDFQRCQLDGNYDSVNKNETHKYCVDPNGEILEDFIVENNSELGKSMNCKCARTRSIMTTNDKPVCSKNGNYSKKQCRRGLCRCVDDNGNQIELEVNVADEHTLSCFV